MSQKFPAIGDEHRAFIEDQKIFFHGSYNLLTKLSFAKAPINEVHLHFPFPFPEIFPVALKHLSILVTRLFYQLIIKTDRDTL